MRSSQITLRDKLGIIISTQYPNDNNVLIDEIDKAKKVLLGLHPDRRYFSLLYEPDDEIRGEWETNDLCIYQSNPVAYTYDYIFEDLKDKRADAVLYENKRQNYLCKHNNIMYKSLGVEGYVDILRLKECKRVKDDDFWRGRSVFIGIDLSQTSDNTAVAMATYEEDVVYARVFAFIPSAAIERKTKKENVDYNAAIKAGDCFPCGDDIIDYEFVERFVLSIEEKYGVRVLQLGFDRWNALSSVQKFENAENAIECVEIRQHSSVLHPATKLLEEKIMERQFVYDENMLLEINFQNARCTTDTNLNKYVNKKKSEGKVDMVVALLNAMYLLNLDMLENDKHGWVVQC
jgi:phage terminase large subunit-like protein